MLRLAYLAKKRGDVDRALHWIDEASKSRAKAPVNQHCLKGKLFFEIGRIQDAKKEFAFILHNIVRDDSYSFLSLANIAFREAIECKENSNNEQDKLLVKAYHKYLEILAHDQNNCFACIGVANVLAHFNKNEDAQEIYKLVG